MKEIYRTELPFYQEGRRLVVKQYDRSVKTVVRHWPFCKPREVTKEVVTERIVGLEKGIADDVHPGVVERYSLEWWDIPSQAGVVHIYYRDAIDAAQTKTGL